MIALLAAATVAAAQPLAPPPNLRWIQPSTFCKTQGTMQTSGPDPALLYRNDGKARAQRLDELPKANLYHAVLRSVGGCAVTKPVRYDVGG